MPGPAVAEIPSAQTNHLQASGPPDLLPFAHIAADKSASLRQEASRARRAAGMRAVAGQRVCSRYS